MEYGATYVSSSNIVFGLLIIGIILILSSYRGIYGRKYRPVRTFIRPILYIILLYAILAISNDVIMSLFSLVLIIFGALLGLRFGGNVKFFYKNDILYYKRSPLVLALWAVVFTVRVFLEFSGFYNAIIIVLIDFLLSLSTGLLIGEAYNIIVKAKKFTSTFRKN